MQVKESKRKRMLNKKMSIYIDIFFIKFIMKTLTIIQISEERNNLNGRGKYRL